MHGSWGKKVADASKRDDTNVVEDIAAEPHQPSDDKSVGDDEDWFAEVAQHLYGRNKPGTAMHYVTGFEERSCQRYAAGSVKPPAYFFRSLLRSPQGWAWLCGAMDGCDQQWWRDVRVAYAIEQRRKELVG